MIYITGDTHIPCDVSKLNTKLFPQQHGLTRDDYLIITGDFGLYWRNDATYKHWYKWIQDKTFTTLWVDGNHENFDWINSMPVTEWHGGKVHKDKNIIHLMRGQVYEISGKKFFIFGGAASVDKAFRQEHVSWWPEELSSREEEEEALNNLAAHNNVVDYIITHTCPKHVIAPMFNLYSNEDPVSRFLDIVSAQATYDSWYFGHFHVDRDYENFNCLYDEIIRLV